MKAKTTAKKTAPPPTREYLPTTPARSTFDPERMCGAQLRRKERGRVCHLQKGFKTPHEGEGRCYLHGGLTPIKHGLTSLVKHGRLKDMIRKIQELDQQVLDLEPEALLMRAMIIDFVNRYDEFRDQLETWYNAIDHDNREIGLPPIPRRYPELHDAAELIEKTSRIVERMAKIQREGSITLDVFRGIMSQMGIIVAQHVPDDAVLQKIEHGWSAVMVNPRSFYRAGADPRVPEPETDDSEE